MLRNLASDIRRYKSSANAGYLVTFVKSLYSHPAFAGIVLYRLSRYLWLRKRNPIFLILLLFARIFYPIIRLYSGLELAPSAEIGPGLWIGHFGPTIIHPATIAGINLTVLHGVTIGYGSGGVPILGDNVSIGTHATLIGQIHIGHNAIIGAGAVVTRNVPCDSIAVGVPARILTKKEEVQFVEPDSL
jgi:serine O-acetyltransferase